MTAQPKAQFEELALAFNNASSPHRTPGALRVHYWLGTAGKHARADLLQLQIARLFGMYTKECTADIGSLAKALGPEKSADVEGLQELAGHAQQLADAACHTAQEPFSLLQQLPSQVGSAAWLAALQDINEQAEQLELIRFSLELQGQHHWHKKPTVQDVWSLPKLAQFEQQRNHPALAQVLNELVLEAMPVLSSAVEGEANKGPCLPEPSIFMPSLAHERLQLLPRECELGALRGDIEDVPLRWAGNALATMQQHQWDEAFLPLLPAATQPLYEAHGSCMHRGSAWKQLGCGAGQIPYLSHGRMQPKCSKQLGQGQSCMLCSSPELAGSRVVVMAVASFLAGSFTLGKPRVSFHQPCRLVSVVSISIFNKMLSCLVCMC